MFCSNCGKNVPDGIRFCPSCGAEIVTLGDEKELGKETEKESPYMPVEIPATAFPVPELVESKYREPVVIQPELHNGEYTEGDRKDIKKSIVMIIAGLVAMAACIAVPLYIHRDAWNFDLTNGFVVKEDNTDRSDQNGATYAGNNLADMIEVLSAAEEKELSEYMEEITNLQSCELSAALVSYDDLGEKAVGEYADNYYNEKGYGVGSDRSGVLFLVAAKEDGHGEGYIYTSGKASLAITDTIIDTYMWPDLSAYLQNKEYNQAIRFFAEQSNDLLTLYGNSGLETDGQSANGNMRDSVFSYNALDYVSLGNYTNMDITVDLSNADTVGEERLTNMAIQQSVRDNFKLTSFPPELVDTVYGYYVAYYMNENGVSTMQELADSFSETEDELHDELMNSTVSEWTSEIILEAIADSEGLQGTEEGLQEYISTRMLWDSVLSEEEYYSKNGMDEIDGKQYFKNCYKGTLAIEWIKENANISYINAPD